MMLTEIKKLYADPDKYGNEKIRVGGWVRTVRDLKSFGFVEINDGSCLKSFQLVLESGLSCFAEAMRLNVGAAVTAEGTLVITPEARQPIELKVSAMQVEGHSSPDYPLQKKRHSMEYLRTIAHLRPRTNTFNAVFRVRSEASFAIHDFFHSRGFVYAHTPIITGNDAEGAGEAFRVTTLDLKKVPSLPNGETDFSQDFFGKSSNLTVSGQLEAEAFALAFGKTYTFGPTFRAENSNTPRHAAEFWMIEPEIAFADIQDNMALAEDMVKHVISYILTHCADEVAFFDRFVDQELSDRLTLVAGSDFGRMSYSQAIEILEKEKDRFSYPVYWGCDLQTEHERFLTEQVMKKPVFITDYPKQIKAFYMRLNDDGKTVAAMDLLVPGVGELIGGSQREERLERLIARMDENGMSTEEYQWYLDLRRFGGVRHSGFGLGFERLIMYLTGMGNIRDVCAFPRTAGWAEF